MEKYSWFLKIILSAPLPENWERETNPEGQVLYHNTKTDELVYTHPMELFFRITFARVVKQKLTADYGQTLTKIILDQISKVHVHELRQKEAALLKMKEEMEEGRNRRIVMGSSAAVSILEKLKDDESSAFMLKHNRAIKRYNKLLDYVMKQKQTVKDDLDYKIDLVEYHKKLRNKFGDKYEALFRKDLVEKLTGEDYLEKPQQFLIRNKGNYYFQDSCR